MPTRERSARSGSGRGRHSGTGGGPRDGSRGRPSRAVGTSSEGGGPGSDSQAVAHRHAYTAGSRVVGPRSIAAASWYRCAALSGLSILTLMLTRTDAARTPRTGLGCTTDACSEERVAKRSRSATSPRTLLTTSQIGAYLRSFLFKP